MPSSGGRQGPAGSAGGDSRGAGARLASRAAGSGRGGAVKVASVTGERPAAEVGFGGSCLLLGEVATAVSGFLRAPGGLEGGTSTFINGPCEVSSGAVDTQVQTFRFSLAFYIPLFSIRRCEALFIEKYH